MLYPLSYEGIAVARTICGSTSRSQDTGARSTFDGP